MAPPSGGILALSGPTMGTRWSARLVSGPSRLGAPTPADVEAAIQDALDTVVAQMSGWDDGSDLSRFNRAPAGHWQPLPPDFATVIACGLEIAALSDGAFDPAAGALVDLWGFGPRPLRAAERAFPPSREAIEAAAAAAGWRNLAYDPAARRLCRATQATLDLSGIAKGYAVDLAAGALRAIGIRDFLIEVGGELRGEGVKPDGQPWWADLEHPPGAESLPVTRIALHGLSVATSGDYRRFVLQEGRRLAHTIDPRTGSPVVNAIASVSVLAADCMRADAWATALTVLGETKGPALAAAQDIAALFVLREDDGWREIITPALQAMLDD